MKIFKFGGVSIQNAEGIRNVTNILSSYSGEKIIAVISALGKTTNLLEKVALSFFTNSPDKMSLFNNVIAQHDTILSELFDTSDQDALLDIHSQFQMLKNYLSKESSENFDYEYDQIVSFGELFSSKILFYFIKKQAISTQWLDARKLVITDTSYREGNINWEKTEKKIQKTINRHWQNNSNSLLITQGFIGGSPEGIVTTLGREGSDFSAAIFAFSLNAESVTIWKDVDGLLNADPKLFPDTVKLDKIPYYEAIELAYYGANVIHPKTLKPLQNKNIPLYVKSFLKPDENGSTVHLFDNKKMIPCFIKKTNQILLSISPKDFSFIAEENLSTIFAIFAHFGFKINLMQNSAISFSVCVDYRENLSQLIEELQTEFYVKYNENVELLTIRHYTNHSFADKTNGKKIILEQRNRTTLQLVLK
ncbi:MAG: aspartate kinase [Bacteroidales bacterium]|nr:aspartate kinase [Bacteroidales bacterium]